MPGHRVPKAQEFAISSPESSDEFSMEAAMAEATDPEEASQDRQGPTLLEDLARGQAEARSGSSATLAPPPEPPRASVDPEPAVVEDPRDFELPHPSHW